MKEQDKNYYEAPSALVFEVKSERSFCQSNLQQTAGLKSYTWNDEVEE